MLDAPTRLLNFPFRLRYRVHGLLILIENETIAAVADGVRLNLNSFSQCLSQQRLQIFFLDRQEPGGVRLVGIRLQQRGTARTERAVGIKLQRTHCQMIIVSADDWAIAEQPLRLRARRGQRLVDAQLDLAFVMQFLEDFNVGKTSARVLHLGPAQLDVALHAKEDSAFGIRRGRAWNVTLYQILRRVEKHSVRLATLLVF